MAEEPSQKDLATLTSYLSECQELVLEQIKATIPQNRFRSVLYDLMLEYPLREGKGFRPALCIATSRAMGGRLQDIIATAATLELFHNAFLLHDDVEDESLMRRGKPTLHQVFGAAIAINVGDAMNALCLQPLLQNTKTLGLSKALKVLDVVSTMAMHSVQGQALELAWIREGTWELGDRDYCLMSYNKTCWYTFIAPMQIGAYSAGANAKQLRHLRRYATYVGLAFQIKDDILNIAGDEKLYGKETAGDLWEGKRTVILLHALRSSSVHEREQAIEMLQKPRAEKTASDVSALLELIQRCGSVDYAQSMADLFSAKASRLFEDISTWMPNSQHKRFLAAMGGYVSSRSK